jgi:periplasmic divalent cation tolerance protein
MKPTMIYVTASTPEEASRIGRILVESRLAACANIFPAVTSIYRWQGKVQDDSEVALVVKTRHGLIDDVVAKIKELHSYDCPCVVALPITAGNPEFLDWIVAETH